MLTKQQFLRAIYSVYVFLFIVISSSRLSDNTLLSTGFSIITVIFILFLLVSICLNSYTVRQIIYVFILCCLLMTSYFYNGNSVLIRGLVIVIALKDVNFDGIIKLDFKVKIFGVLTVILLNLGGVIDSHIIFRGDVVRYSLGFTHPNTLAIFICIIILQWLYIRYYKLKIYETTMIIIITMLTDYITNSRTSTYIIVVALILYFIFRKFEFLIDKSYIIKYLITYTVPILSIISYLSMRYYDVTKNFALFLDQLLSGRIRLMNYFYNSYGISLWGQEVTLISTRIAEEAGVPVLVIDNAYMALAIRFGVIALFLTCFLFVKLQKELISKKQYSLVVLIICFGVMGLMENHFYIIEYNFTLLAFILVIQHFKKQNNIEKQLMSVECMNCDIS